MSAVFDDAEWKSTSVQGILNYTRKTGVRPVNYTFDPPPGIPRNSGEIDARTVTIHNARLETGLARLTAHTAFDDPTSPPNAPSRRSVELRAMVFW